MLPVSTPGIERRDKPPASRERGRPLGNVIVVGDSEQVATYVEQHLQIIHFLKELKTMNADLQAKFDKLNADITADKAANQAKGQHIAQLTQQVIALTNQVATLTAADQATTQAVGAAVDAADAAVVAP